MKSLNMDTFYAMPETISMFPHSHNVSAYICKIFHYNSSKKNRKLKRKLGAMLVAKKCYTFILMRFYHTVENIFSTEKEPFL